jgi:adenine-specific DNA-methyltransferase
LPTRSLVRVSRHGELAASEAEPTNVLIEGDAFDALTVLSSDEHHSPPIPIKLAYLDPPFNTQSAFADYHDALDPAVWLTMLRDRIELVISLLADDGSIWVHCDDRGQAYLRVLLDELMGRESFIGTIVWQRRYSRDNRPALGPVHDYIHVYSPLGLEWKRVRNRLPRAANEKGWSNPDNDPRGLWNTHSLVAQGGHGTPAQFYSITTPSGRAVTPPHGSCWRVTKERFDELVGDGRIWFGRHGNNVPRKKVFLSEAKGLVPWSWWPYEEVGHNEESRRELRKLFPDVAPFTTPKPERLIHRIVHVATQPGDVVLDCFLGSGTTAAVAHKMRRRWIGVEASASTIHSFALPRLEAVVEGRDPGGITQSVTWRGGGGFWFARLVDALPVPADHAVAV